MKFCFRQGWVWAFLLSLMWPALLPAQNANRIRKIELKFVGPPPVSEAFVRANIRVKESESYSRIVADDDVRNLYTTGYFYNIQVTEERGEGGITLTYVLQGKPTVTDIQFTGNKKFSRAKLARKTTSKVGQPLDERKLFEDAQAIKTMYQKSGYPKTEVKYVPNINADAGRGTVTFEITETPKVRVIEVYFDGAQAFSQKKLRKTIKTRRHWMFSWLTGSGKLKDEQLEEDRDRLAEFFQNEGYIDFELKEIKYDYLTPKRLKLHFVISEGRQYRVGAIDFKGVNLFPTNDVMRTLKMKVGEHFTPKGLVKDIEAIQNFYGAKGFIGEGNDEHIRVFARKNANTDTGTMDLVYELQEGEKSYIEKIEIKGNSKTKDKVIRRELSVSPGEVFDLVRVKRSKGRLEQMNYFEKVETKTEETDVPNRKNLIVAVDEKGTGNFQIGAGFSSIDSLVGFATLTQGNFDLFHPPTFTGAGQKFRLHATVGTQRQDYEMTFIEPWFLNRKLQLGVDLYYRDLGFYSDFYDERIAGTRLSLTKALGSEFLIGSAHYTLENVGIVNVQPTVITDSGAIDYRAPPEIVAEKGYQLVSKFGASLAYDTRNNVLLPSKGQRSEIFADVAGGPLGGDANFYKVELKTAWYFPGFAEGHIWEVDGRLAVADKFGNSPVVPLFERYFLGGATSLRGYKYRRVSPTSTLEPENDEPIGGNTLFFGSVEYSIPIIERLRVAWFYDIGNVQAESYKFDFADYFSNWGLGLRINIPQIGPLRLDYGIPISRSGSGRFNFTVGYTKDF